MVSPHFSAAIDMNVTPRLPPCSALLAPPPPALELLAEHRRSNVYSLMNRASEPPEPESSPYMGRKMSMSPTPSLTSVSSSCSSAPSPPWSLSSLPNTSHSTSPLVRHPDTSYSASGYSTSSSMRRPSPYHMPRQELHAVRPRSPSPSEEAEAGLGNDVLPTPSPLDNEWKAHVTGDDDHTRCTWVMPDGRECGFDSRKHATKRHIETTHLQIKRWVCTLCTKDFTQKASLLRHHSLHTGEMPFKCQYKGCDRTFNDRSRRHKHMIDAHQHQPKPHQRRNKVKP